MSTPAQDEFDGLFSSLDSGPKTHPEDRSESSSSEHDGTTLHSGNDDGHTTESNSSTVMPSATYIPTNTQFDANTGPKGVIADAQSFETAKKRSFRQTLYAFTSGESPPLFGKNKKFNFSREKSKSPSPDLSADDEEDDFMRTWRANRLEQLASVNQSSIRTRRQSPSKRRYGSLVTVDPSGYLDAVEKVTVDTTVVVLIYDDEVRTSTRWTLEFLLIAPSQTVCNQRHSRGCSQRSGTKACHHPLRQTSLPRRRDGRDSRTRYLGLQRRGMLRQSGLPCQ